MHAYITGATGFIGSRLTRALLAAGDGVSVLARTPSRAADLESEGARVVAGDVTDEVEQLAVGMSGADVVFHLAAIYEIGPADIAATERINVHGTRQVIDAARAAEVPSIVYVSTVAAYGSTRPGEVADETHLEHYTGEWKSTYERTKHGAHLIAQRAAEDGAPVRIASPGGVYGPGDTSMVGVLLKTWLRGLAPMVPFGRARFSFVHVDDVVTGLRLVYEQGAIGRDYILGGQIASILDFVTAAARASGRRPPRGVLPTRALRVMAPMSGPFLPRLGMNTRMLREGIPMLDGRDWAYSPARAQAELGYTYRSLDQGMPETVAWARHDLGAA